MADKFDGWYDKWEPKVGNFEVPDYRIYNKIDGIWELEHTRDVLAKRGLKDPWMRNEIYRYPKWARHSIVEKLTLLTFGPKLINLRRALVATTCIIVAQNIYWKYKFGKKPVWVTDFRDWLEEYYQYRNVKNQ